MNNISPQTFNLVAARQKPTTNTEPPKASEVKIHKPIYKGAEFSSEKKVELGRLYSRRADIARYEIVDTVFNMRKSYTDMQIELSDRHPQLSKKDWDFTVDEKGELLIVEGEDKLSKKEIKTLIDTMTEQGLDKYMKKLAENIVERGVGGRRYYEYQKDSDIGQYDVTMENMSEILRGRELMSDSQMRLMNRGPEKIMRGIAEYNKNKMDPYMAVFKQVIMRAEKVYHTNDHHRVEVTGEQTSYSVEQLRELAAEKGIDYRGASKEK